MHRISQCAQEQGIARTLDEAYDDAAHRDSYVTAVPGSIALEPSAADERGGAQLRSFPARLCSSLPPWVSLHRDEGRGCGALVTAGGVGFVLSFGPTWGEKDAGFPLPYRFLYQHVIAYQGLRGPDRFASLVLLALAPLAALGATALWQARRIAAVPVAH